MLSERLEYLAPSYTINMGRKVAELTREGKKVYALHIGEPNFSIPDKSKESVIQALENDCTKYDNVSGLFELREAIMHKLKRDNDLDYSMDEIVVSNGGKQCLFNALYAITNPNDEILIPVPYWVSYPEIVKLCGGEPVFMMPSDTNNLKISPLDLAEKITPKTKAIMLNNPANPTGSVYSKKELADIAALCIKNNLYIISDEVYEKFCYDSAFCSIASVSEEVKNRTIIVNSLSKTASMMGLRIGYTASNKIIATAMSTIQGHQTSHPSTLSQWAAVPAMTDSDAYIENVVSTYRERRSLIMTLLKDIPDLLYTSPSGAFYVFVSLASIAHVQEYFAGEKSFSMAFSEKLLEDKLVSVVPGIGFGMDDYIRISYTSPEEDLREGLKRLKEFIESLKS